MSFDTDKFVTYNYVVGAQKFLKEAGLVKYANEMEADTDANAITEALMEQPPVEPVEGGIPEDKVLEIADAIIELAQNSGAPSAETVPLEAAAAGMAGGNGEEGEEEEEEEEDEDEKEEDMKEAKLRARKFAALIRKQAGDTETNPKPDQVLSISDTDYQRATSSANAPGTGTTTLPTEKGEIGALQNKEDKIVVPEVADANIKQHVEGKDIHGKDYAAPGKGNTGVNTESGEIGAQQNVDHKLAALAMQSTLAKILNK